MDFDQFMRIDPNVLYRKYLFRTGNFEEWMNVWIYKVNRFIPRCMKRYCLILAILLNLFTSSLAADGTNYGFLVGQYVNGIKRNMDVYMKAYEEIAILAESIGTATEVTNVDERFVYAFLITKWSREFGFDPVEVAAVALTESQFNPKAVSAKDARGLMQIHRPSWDMDDYFNTEKNIRMAMRILYMYRNSHPASYLKLYYGDTGEDGVQYVRKVRGNYEKLTGIQKGAKDLKSVG